MTKTSRETVRTSVILPKDQYAQLNEIAQKSDVSVAWVVRKAILQFLEESASSQLYLPIDILKDKDHDK